MEEQELERGTQIIYVPMEAHGSLSYPTCETGFVTSVRDDEWAFCRYWSKFDEGELRTKSCSELTSINQLVVMETVPKIRVDEALCKIGPAPTTISPLKEE